MVKAYTSWTPLPHGPIETLSDNLWRVEGTLPDMPLRRVMTVVRLADGRLLIHNAIALDEAVMEEIDGWGTPAFLIVPNGWHRLDARAYRDRYPGLQVLCPAGSTKRVAQVVGVDGSYDDFCAGGEAVQLLHLDGVDRAEGVLQVRSEDGVTLVFNDVIFNQPHLPGFQGLIMRVIGSTGGPKVTHVARLMMTKDRKALRAHLERLSRIDGLRRVIVSHGQMVSADPGEMLRRAAATL